MKRRLALLVCIIATLAMVFALASCGGDKCEHTYSTEYTTDANGHWYVATCGCEGEVSNYGAHVDSNNNGECDTCKYVLCAHTYETEWSTDETNHWNASNCGCTGTKANEAKHEDKIINADKSEGKDGICDVCEYVVCNHAVKDEWTTDEENHWKEPNCECDVEVANKGAHADDNEDGRCDTCGYVTSFDYVLKTIINGLDSEAWFGANSSIILVNDEETFTKIYDNYTVVKDNYGNTKYYSYYGENDAYLFVAFVSEYGVERYEVPEIEGVAEYSLVYYKVEATNHEDMIKGLYNLAMNGSVDYEGNPDGKSYGLVSTQDEEAGKYSFSYLFTIYESAYYVEVEFEIDAETNGIKSATVTIDNYDLVDVTLDEENLTYTINEGAEATTTTYEVTQTFGDPMSSEETPNPYPASDYVIDDLKLVDENTSVEIKDGDVVEILAGYSNGLSLVLPEDQADLADFQLFTVTTEMTTGWLNYPVRVYSDNAGEYEVEITNGLDTLSFTVKVSYLAPQTMSTNTINLDTMSGTSENELTIYNGQSLMINSVVAAGCDPTFTAEVTVGADTAMLTRNENGTYTFKPVMVGEYEVKLTSSVASDVTATIKVTVIAPPTIEEILDGSYEGTSSYNWIDIEAEFGAENTVVITLDGSVRSWDYENNEYVTTDLSGTATYTYVYDAETGMLALTKTEGDDLVVESVYVQNYEVYVALTGDMPCKLEKVVDEEPTEKEPTSNPFKVTITDTYTYDTDTFEFVADEAGKYTFTVPAGLGVASGGNFYVDYYANTEGTTFEIDLDANEVVVFNLASVTKGDYYMSYTVSAAEPETPVEGGLAGTYEAADDWGNTFTVTITDTTITFQPPRSPMVEWTYTYIDGVLTVYSAGTELTNPMMGGAAVDADKNVFSELYNNGTTYALTKLAAAGSEEQSYAGTYTAADDYGNNLTVVITDDTITFTDMRGVEVVWTYEVDNGIVTLYSDGIAITMPMMGYAEVDTVNYAFKSMIYNGTTYTLTKAAGGNEEEPEENTLAGAYTATDSWDNSFAVTITEDTISFTPPRSPEIVWTYTYENGILTVYSQGTALTNPMMGGAEVANGVFTTLYNNGTTYTLTKAGATEPDDGEEEEVETVTELVVGDNNVSATGGDMNVVTYTATANGTITVYVGANGVVGYDYYYYLENESFTVNVKAGDVVSFEINSMDYTACVVVVTVAFEEEKVVDPQAELKALLAGDYKIGDYSIGLTQDFETGVYHILVMNDDMSIFLAYTYTVVDNEDGTFSLTSLVAYDTGYSAGADQSDAVKATVEAGTISANLTNNKAFGYYENVNGYAITLNRDTTTGAYTANIAGDNWATDLYFTYVATDNGNGTFTIALTYTKVDWESGADKVDSLLAMTWVVTPVSE